MGVSLKGSTASKRRKVQPKETLSGLIEECDKAQAAVVLDCHTSIEGAIDLNGTASATWDRADSIVDIIKRRVNDSRFAPAMPVELQLDHVLSSVPYQAMLESLFGGVSQPAHEVPLVTKTYEESFMREPVAGELPCALGDLCECRFIDKNAPFIGVQFELPGTRQDQRDGSANMCVLCYRKTTQKLFYDACYSGKECKASFSLTGISATNQGNTPEAACSSVLPARSGSACRCQSCHTNEIVTECT